MKKVLSSALALGLVAGVATSAAAFDSFKASGYYTVQGYNVNSAGVLTSTPGSNADASSSWYEHTFHVNPDLQVNDKIHMKANVRLAHENQWGGGSGTDLSTTGGRRPDIHKLYMEYASPVGKIRLGRTPGGAWKTSFVDTAGNANRIMWWPNMLPKPFNALVFLQKTQENDAAALGTASDQDSDYYEVDLGYKTDMVNATIAYGLTDDQSATGTDKSQSRIKGHAKVTMDNMYVETEFDHLFGDTETGNVSTDYDAWAFMLDAGTTVGKLDIGLMYWYLSGDDGTSTDLEAYTGLGGKNFSPLMVAYHDGLGILNPNAWKTGAMSTSTSGTTANMQAGTTERQNAGQHGLALHAGYTVSDKVSLWSALGTVVAADELAGYDDEYGWEFDLGVAYKLLDNLTYGVNFGYFDTGDFFKGYTAPGGTNTLDTEDVYVLHNSLNMTF